MHVDCSSSFPWRFDKFKVYMPIEYCHDSKKEMSFVPRFNQGISRMFLI